MFQGQHETNQGFSREAARSDILGRKPQVTVAPARQSRMGDRMIISQNSPLRGRDVYWPISLSPLRGFRRMIGLTRGLRPRLSYVAATRLRNRAVLGAGAVAGSPATAIAGLRNLLLLVGLVCGLAAPSVAQDAFTPPPPKPPAETAEEAFKRSLGESIDQRVDPKKFGAFIAAVVGFTLLAVVVSQWRARSGRKTAGGRNLNSPSKLIREVGKSINLRPAEVKQLKLLSQQQNIGSPLVLLLCPSVLSRAVKDNSRRIDRTVLTGLAKKIVSRTR